MSFGGKFLWTIQTNAQQKGRPDHNFIPNQTSSSTTWPTSHTQSPKGDCSLLCPLPARSTDSHPLLCRPRQSSAGVGTAAKRRKTNDEEEIATSMPTEDATSLAANQSNESLLSVPLDQQILQAVDKHFSRTIDTLSSSYKPIKPSRWFPSLS